MKVLQNLNDGGINTDNEIILKLFQLLLEEYAFFSDPANRSFYERPLEETFARFDAFLNDNEQDWTNDTIVTDEDKDFFLVFMQYFILLIQYATRCADISIDEYSRRILDILERLGIDPDPQNPDITFVAAFDSTNNINVRPEITVTDISSNVTDNQLNFREFINTLNKKTREQ